MSWPRKIFKLQDGFIRQDPEQLVGKKVLLLREKIGVIRGYKPPTTWRKETYCIEIENQRLEIHSRKCAKLGIIGYEVYLRRQEMKKRKYSSSSSSSMKILTTTITKRKKSFPSKNKNALYISNSTFALPNGNAGNGTFWYILECLNFEDLYALQLSSLIKQFCIANSSDYVARKLKKLLLTHKKMRDIYLKYIDERYGSSPFICASIRGNYDDIVFLATHYNIDIYSKTRKPFASIKDVVNQVGGGFGRTALMLATLYKHTNIVEFLLNNGADVSIAARGGTNVFHFISCNHYQYTRVVQLILNHPTTTAEMINELDHEGHNALDICNPLRKKELVAAFVKFGAKYSLFQAIKAEDIPLMDKILKSGRQTIRFTNKENNSNALHIAADWLENNLDVWRWLLNHTDMTLDIINAVDSNKCTPLDRLHLFNSSPIKDQMFSMLKEKGGKLGGVVTRVSQIDGFTSSSEDDDDDDFDEYDTY